MLVPTFSWTQAIVIMVIGNVVAGIMMVLMGHMGVDRGIPAAVMNRLFFGNPIGATLCSIVMLTSLTGWYAVQAEFGGLALDQAINDLFGYSNPVLMIMILSGTNVVVAIFGIESIKWLSRFSVPFLLIIFTWVGFKILSQHRFIELIDYEATGGVSLMTGVDWMIGGWVVGIFVASDISRHVKSRKHNWMGTMIGLVPAAIFLSLLGALSSLATGDWNPVKGITALGLGAPALIVIMFSTWTTNDINLYNGGLALSNIVPKISRWKNTLMLGVAGTILAVLRITDYFTTFLESLSMLFGPLIGVAIADYFIVRKGKFDLKDIYQEGKKNKKLYRFGLNWIAFVAVTLGTVIALNTPEVLPPSVISILMSVVVYLFLIRIAGKH